MGIALEKLMQMSAQLLDRANSDLLKRNIIKS